VLIDRGKVCAEERLDGKYVLVTNELELPAEELVLGYRQLYLAERAFRSPTCTCVCWHTSHAGGGEPHRRVLGAPAGAAWPRVAGRTGDAAGEGAQDEAPDRIRSGQFQKMWGVSTTTDRGDLLGIKLSPQSSPERAVVHVPIAHRASSYINSSFSRSMCAATVERLSVKRTLNAILDRRRTSSNAWPIVMLSRTAV